jgi:hypothetical protein
MVVRYDFGTMAKLLVPREQVRKMLAERIRAAEDVDAKAEIAAKNWRGDWLDLFAKWRDDTIKELLGAYEGRAIAQEFAMVTERSEGYSAQATFETRRLATRSGIRTLEGLLEGLPLGRSHRYQTSHLWTACIPTFSQGVAACSMAGTTPRRSRRDSRSFETGFALWPVTKLALKLLGRGNST